MEWKSKISIIVPIYNVENYLRECLESIKNQTFTNFECIMINDGSTDSSQEIAEQYLEDERFYLINQNNSGQSVARNRAINLAKGEYVCFVDSDDMIHPRLLELLANYIQEDVDIIEADFTDNLDDFIEENCSNVHISFEGYGENVLKACIDTWAITHQPVAKLIRKSLIENVLFPENLIYEDLYTGIALFKKIRKAVKLDFYGYYYRPNPLGTMKGSTVEKQLDIFPICELLEKYYSDKQEYMYYIHTVIFHHIAQRYMAIKKQTNKYDKQFNHWLNKYSKDAYPNDHYLKTSKLYPSKFFYIKSAEQFLKKILRKVKKHIGKNSNNSTNLQC